MFILIQEFVALQLDGTHATHSTHYPSVYKLDPTRSNFALSFERTGNSSIFWRSCNAVAWHSYPKLGNKFWWCRTGWLCLYTHNTTDCSSTAAAMQQTRWKRGVIKVVEILKGLRLDTIRFPFECCTTHALNSHPHTTAIEHLLLVAFVFQLISISQSPH